MEVGIGYKDCSVGGGVRTGMFLVKLTITYTRHQLILKLISLHRIKSKTTKLYAHVLPISTAINITQPMIGVTIV